MNAKSNQYFVPIFDHDFAVLKNHYLIFSLDCNEKIRGNFSYAVQMSLQFDEFLDRNFENFLQYQIEFFYVVLVVLTSQVKGGNANGP